MKTKDWVTAFKWFVVLVVAVLIFMFTRGCGKGTCQTVVEKKDSIVYVTKIDTQYVPQPKVGKEEVVYTPIPHTRPEMKPITKPEWLTAIDSARIIDDYFSNRIYGDTVYKGEGGYVVVNDSLSRNRILGRGVKASITSKTITETKTITAPLRTVGYVGLEAFGNKTAWVKGFAASFGLKMRNENYYGVKVVVIGAQAYYGPEIKFPIRIKRK